MQAVKLCSNKIFQFLIGGASNLAVKLVAVAVAAAAVIMLAI